MIENDQAILQRLVENWEREIPNYIERLEDKIISRVILPVRKVGENIAFDVVQTQNRTGKGAQFVAKGVAPVGSGIDTTDVPHLLYQALDGFLIHEKDLKLGDGKLKDRKMQIVLKNMQRFENYVAINGDAATSVPGVKTMALANTNGVVGTGDIVGPWDKSGTAPDIYEDMLTARNKMDGDFEPRWLVGNRADINYIYGLDSERKPFWKSMSTIFGKTPTDPIDSWVMELGSTTLTAGKVYMCTMDEDAAEMVIGEDRKIRTIPQQPGGNYPIEVYSWYTNEAHDNQGFVEIATS